MRKALWNLELSGKVGFLAFAICKPRCNLTDTPCANIHENRKEIQRHSAIS
jgi:hypothetical protein